MKKTIILTVVALVLCLFALDLRGQDTRLFMPREIRQAYENGTRSYDGRPGPNYWQNTVDYTIEVAVIPEEKKLQGSEQVVYHNNSPDELNTIVVRLYHDLFRKANPRAYRVRPDDINEGVELTKLEIDGEAYDPESREVRRNGTNTTVRLKKPLAPGAKLNLAIDWSQQIPETTIRTGAIDSTTFFVAYWYPQIAVYDDVFGWDNLPYDFSAEFYNNLGNFDVKITAPDHYTVVSTGALQNAGEVLAKPQLERYEKAKSSSETVVIVTPEDLESDFHHKGSMWHFKAENVTDFSFAVSDRFSWDAAVQKVEDRNVLINTFYPASGAEACGGVTAMQQKIMKHFSEDVPGIPYPYPEFTTFISSVRGGGGMETPMMANNGGPGRGVTIHEMFHTYFPMYVRTNEKRFAWMDEGWADFNTALVNNRYFEDDNGLLFSSVSGGIDNTLGTISDLPLITSTQFTDNTNYGYSAYPLPAFLYATLHHHLGEELFMQCYREYIRRWATKAPTPYDFFYTFEHVSGQDLSWFWKPWFFEFGSVEVQIQSYKNGKLVLENKGSRPVPVVVKVAYQDDQVEEVTASASVWKGESTFKTKIPRGKEVKSLIVNAGIPDTDPLNNSYPPLKDLYKAFNIPKDIQGDYYIEAFRVNLSLVERDGVLFADSNGGPDFYLRPISTSEFESLDGSVKFSFKVEDGKYKSVQFKYFGYDLEGVKQ